MKSHDLTSRFPRFFFSRKSLALLAVAALLALVALLPGPQQAQAQSDTEAPRATHAAVNQETLTLTFDQDLDTASKPSPSAFTVTVNNARRNVASGGVAISGSTVTLTLASAVSAGETVTVSYTKPTTSPLQSVNDGYAVETFSNQAVTNNTAGTVWSATLTVASNANGDGCNWTLGPCRAQLTDHIFTHRGVNHQVTHLTRYKGDSAALGFRISRSLPERQDWTLFVDDRPFHLGDATFDNANLAKWQDHGIDWTTGQQVSVRLSWKTPTLRWAAVDGTALTMIFSENLDTASKPSPSAFTVTVNNAQRNVASDGVAISGSTVTLTLASAVSAGETVTVRYAKPSANPLQGAADNDVETFVEQDVANTTPIGIWSATLTVDRDNNDEDHELFGCSDVSAEYIDDCATGLTDHTFARGNTSYEVTSIWWVDDGSGEQLDLHLDKAIPRDWVLHVGNRQFPIAESDSSDAGDNFGWEDPGLTWTENQEVSLRLTAPPLLPTPVFQSAAVNEETWRMRLSKKLTMTFSENLDTASKPAPSAFTVTVNNDRRNVASRGVAVSGKKVTLTLASAVFADDTVTVSYTKPSINPLKRIYNGFAVATFSDQAVTNNARTVWSATLTVGTTKQTENGNGCRNGQLTTCSTALSDDDFTVGGVDYQVFRLDTHGTTGGDYFLDLELDQVIPAGWKLHIDYRSSFDAPLVVSDADNTFNGGKQVRWTKPAGKEERLWRFRNGQLATVSLERPGGASGASGASGNSGGSGLIGQPQEQVPAVSVTGVSVVSDPGPDQTYGIGDTIQVRVTFNQLVVDVDTSGGTPRLKIDMDPAEWGEKWASYASGSGSPNLIFTHTVVEPNISTQGIAVLESTLELNGGTIRSGGEDADLVHAGLAHDADHKVDWQESGPPANSPATGAPTITGTARVGETLTAGTSGISDSDGLTGATFSYQWLADGADVSGATGSAYAPTSADVGKAVRVRVSFTDDAGNPETLTSAATTAVAAKPPEVTAVSITSDPGGDDTYGKDDVIRITLTFDEAVDVDTAGGTPQLTIDMDPADWGEKQASYASGSGTTALTFIHTVVEPNVSTQGIAVLADTLDLNGGDIESAATDTDADLSHTGLAHDAGHKVDWEEESGAGGNSGGASGQGSGGSGSGGQSGNEEQQSAPASVSGVAMSSSPQTNATYGLGETIRVTLTFDEAVDVSGTPRLKIDMDPADWGEQWAEYEGGSGTTSLTFTHTVAEPNISTQGIAVLADTLDLNGGTIGSDDVAADLSHTGLAHDANHKVDWRLPLASVTGVSVTSDPGGDDTYGLNDVISVTLTFSEAVDVTGTPQLTIDMDPAEWGEKQASYASGSGSNTLVFTHTVVEPNYSTQGIAVLANSLALNGGAIGSDGLAALLAHTGLAHDAGHKVDWQD